MPSGPIVMWSLTVIIPNYNEPPASVIGTAEAMRVASAAFDLENVDVVVFDAGSNIQSLRPLFDFKAIEVWGASCPWRPNKNYGVAQVAGNCTSELIAVVDADWGHRRAPVDRLIANLVRRETRFVMPRPELSAGRDNRLVGGPLLRLFWPKVYEAVQHPFPGIYGGNTDLILAAVANDYHFDWGGELDLLLNIARLTPLANVATPSIPIFETRHRSMRSKFSDAIQMIRAALLRDDCERASIWQNLSRAEDTYPSEWNDFLDFSSIHLAGRTPVDFATEWSERTPFEIYWQLIELAQTTGRLELVALAQMTALPLAVLQGEALESVDWQLIPDGYSFRSLNLSAVSLLADAVICATLSNREYIVDPRTDSLRSIQFTAERSLRARTTPLVDLRRCTRLLSEYSEAHQSKDERALDRFAAQFPVDRHGLLCSG